MKEISLEEMLESGVHFGHKVGRLYPKMKPFVFSVRNGIYIIDLEKTKEKLDQALAFVKKLGQENKMILMVATKRQAQAIVQKYAKEMKMPYVTERWIGGGLTNFSVILKMINNYKKLKDQRDKGELSKYTKKEQLKISTEIGKLDAIVGGLQNMTRLPDAIFIIDLKNEATVLKEARKKNIPIIGLVDVNCNPDGIKYPIPANDDASKGIALITGAIAEAYLEGTKNPVKEPEKKAGEKKEGENKEAAAAKKEGK